MRGMHLKREIAQLELSDLGCGKQACRSRLFPSDHTEA
jgi:hypothetical protein